MPPPPPPIPPPFITHALDDAAAGTGPAPFGAMAERFRQAFADREAELAPKRMKNARRRARALAAQSDASDFFVRATKALGRFPRARMLASECS